MSISITFSECVENHKGMEMIGTKAPVGLKSADLAEIRANYERTCGERGKLPVVDELHLSQFLSAEKRLEFPVEAQNSNVLVLRGGVQCLTNVDNANAFTSLKNLNWDKHALMYGKVVNKLARWNLCFTDIAQEPVYLSGKGRIITFEAVPILQQLRAEIAALLPAKLTNLYAEGNYYYDFDTGAPKTGIGFHGDTERRIVVAARFGAPNPIVYQWHYRNVTVSDKIRLDVNGGDIYFMGEKATGNDWKSKNKPTLRHAAGGVKYIN